MQVLDAQMLRVPDYPGNSMFNTLGNFVVNPQGGLVFWDFANYRMLQLVGWTELRWGLDDAQPTGGTKRYWDFTVTAWREADLPHTLDWEFLDYSPHHPQD